MTAFVEPYKEREPSRRALLSPLIAAHNESSSDDMREREGGRERGKGQGGIGELGDYHRHHTLRGSKVERLGKKWL